MLLRPPKARRCAADLAALLLVFTGSAATASQNAAFWKIHAQLQDHRKLAQQRGAVLIAEITKLESIPRPSCKAGVEHRATYRVVESLWNEPDSPEKPGYLISRDFIDCTEKPLTSPPFAVGVRVLLYCRRLKRYGCLSPALYSEESFHQVQQWLDHLSAEEGDAALLQVHESLLHSAELLRSVPAGRPVAVNGELGWPFLFTGQVKSIEPPPLQVPIAMSVAIRRYMEIAVSKVLWGKFEETVVHAWCNSTYCGGAQPKENVIMHCQATRLARFECSPPSVYSEEKLKKVESWVAGQSYH